MSDCPGQIDEKGVATDRAALEAFYDATGGDGWHVRGAWKTDAPLGQWHGITTDASGRVTELWMTDHHETMSGALPAELGNLANLKTLYIVSTPLSGAIPAELGNLSNLQSISLQRNQLTGPIPATLGKLTNLKSLILRHNQLTGAIPAALGDLTNLEWLDLSHNRLSGTIPAELGKLSGLRLTEASELDRTASTERLDLSHNRLSGKIPEELANLGSRTLFHLTLGHFGLCVDAADVSAIRTRFRGLDQWQLPLLCPTPTPSATPTPAPAATPTPTPSPTPGSVGQTG